MLEPLDEWVLYLDAMEEATREEILINEAWEDKLDLILPYYSYFSDWLPKNINTDPVPEWMFGPSLTRSRT